MPEGKSTIHRYAKQRGCCCAFGLLIELATITHEQVADELGVSPKTVYNFRRAARQGRIYCEHPGRSDCVRTIP
jgi:hypothetical protein